MLKIIIFLIASTHLISASHLNESVVIDEMPYFNKWYKGAVAKALPEHINENGVAAGPWVFKQADDAAVNFLRRFSNRAITTAAGYLKFCAPVLKGDEVSFYVKLIETKTTSMTCLIEGYSHRVDVNDPIHIASGKFCFVAIGADTKKRPLPEGKQNLRLETPPEKKNIERQAKL
ncbi:MAG: acyl-CoA thioesterase [Alphaproteobacteria bacterium]|nr:acyl-CoA thioesterase [Alphaproteobacteria bacterium]